jgi:hypothetical protein
MKIAAAIVVVAGSLTSSSVMAADMFRATDTYLLGYRTLFSIDQFQRLADDLKKKYYRAYRD